MPPCTCRPADTADPRPAPLGAASVGATTIGDDESPFEAAEDHGLAALEG
jgi:hypothetical protein